MCQRPAIITSHYSALAVLLLLLVAISVDLRTAPSSSHAPVLLKSRATQTTTPAIAAHGRGTSGGRASYLQSFGHGGIGGWMDASAFALIVALSRAQHDSGLRGSVGEIGVHEGLSFLAAALSSDESEQLWACDVFERQELNVDQSGRGDLGRFSDNLRGVGLDVSDALLFVGSSTSIPQDYFEIQNVAPFRYFSIDGGHTRAITLNDLRLAARSISSGGIVALDDIKNSYWAGVREGLLDFLAESSKGSARLAPFATNHKVFLTTPQNHPVLLNKTREIFEQAGLGAMLVLEEAGGPFLWPVLHIKSEWDAPVAIFEKMIKDAWLL